MGGCCSCLDGIRGGKHGNAGSSNGDTEMTSRNSASGIPPPTHGISRAMSAPTIQIQGHKVSGTGLALAKIPIEQGMIYLFGHEMCALSNFNYVASAVCCLPNNITHDINFLLPT